MSPTAAAAAAAAATADTSEIPAHKSSIRARIWRSLLAVARPDSRFHTDFSCFIPDFRGSGDATALLTSLPAYRGARAVFVAPDNCLEELRAAALRDGKTVLVTSYAIRRGFWVLEPGKCAARCEYAATLDGMERVGRHVGLGELRRGGRGDGKGMQVDLLVTGTGAINHAGVRFGKGHGFFDLEWAMLYSVGAVDLDTPAVAVVHECQLVDEPLRPDVFDTVCDVVVTNERALHVEAAKKPDCGILWERLEPGMLEDIPPLRELKEMQEREGKASTVDLRGR